MSDDNVEKKNERPSVGHYAVTEKEREEMISKMKNKEEMVIHGRKMIVGEIDGAPVAVGAIGQDVDPRSAVSWWLDKTLREKAQHREPVHALVAYEHHEGQWSTVLLVKGRFFTHSDVFEIIAPSGNALLGQDLFKGLYIRGGAKLSEEQILSMLPEKPPVKCQFNPSTTCGGMFVVPEAKIINLDLYHQAALLYFFGKVVHTNEWKEAVSGTTDKVMRHWGSHTSIPIIEFVDRPKSWSKWHELNPIEVRVRGAKVANKHLYYRCSICHAAKNLLKCSRCKDAWYCSRECQRADWKVHKPVCDAKQKSKQ